MLSTYLADLGYTLIALEEEDGERSAERMNWDALPTEAAPQAAPVFAKPDFDDFDDSIPF